MAYHLLPVRSSPRGSYLWLYFDELDSTIAYDARRSVLKRGDKILVRGVSPVKLFGAEAALYEATSGVDTRRSR